MLHRPFQTATGVSISIVNMIPQGFFGDASGTAWEVSLMSDTPIPVGAWAHFAVSRQGGDFRMFINGNLTASATSVGLNINDSGGNVFIGRSEPGNYLNAYLNDFRITKGICRYSAPFTPPTSRFPDA